MDAQVATPSTTRRDKPRPFDETRPFREILDTLEAEDRDAGSKAVEAKVDTTSIEAILAQRNATHGSFSDNARVSQALKRIMRAELGWEMLTDIEREVIDQIALKFSRIVSGKSREKQHWEDVVGYGTLAEKDCI